MVEQLRELRKERIEFYMTVLPDIAETLKEANIPEDMQEPILSRVSEKYTDDIDLAQDMLATDLPAVDDNLFVRVINEVDEQLQSLLEGLTSLVEEEFDDRYSSGSNNESE